MPRRANAPGLTIKIIGYTMKGDYCTREGAERLKQQIEAYWAERGHDVKVNLVQGGFLASMRSARTDVRSNLVNGVPGRAKQDFG
jgi:hypothetical protein